MRICMHQSRQVVQDYDVLYYTDKILVFSQCVDSIARSSVNTKKTMTLTHVQREDSPRGTRFKFSVEYAMEDKNLVSATKYVRPYISTTTTTTTMSATATNPPTNCLLNGNGRIGRLLFKYIFDNDPTLSVTTINDVCSIESAAYLLKYDSVHGTWVNHTVTVDGNHIVIDVTHRIAFTQAETPDAIPNLSDVDVVLECTGKFLNQATLAAFEGKQVVVSAPVKEKIDGVPTALNIVLGCNQDLLTHHTGNIVTNASCTTNCLAPIVKVMLNQFGIRHGCITTVHDVTGTQTLVDMPNTKKSDLRRARSGMVNLCPTSTGSATAIIEIYPELAGKLNGLAIRVPLTNASLTDCVFEVSRPVTVEEVNAALRTASTDPLAFGLVGILGYETAPLVSSDYTNDTRSCVVDEACTQVIDGTLVKIYAWYDNEAGYSKRMQELAHIRVHQTIRSKLYPDETCQYQY